MLSSIAVNAQINKHPNKLNYVYGSHSLKDRKSIVKSTLFKLMSNLEYDSVKVYNINCALYDVEPFSVSIDTPSVYFRLYKSKDSLTFGKKLEKKDVFKLVHLIKYIFQDIYTDDPIGYFFPVIGIAFFKNNKVIANIEHSLISEGLTIRILRKGKSDFKEYWSVEGINMWRYFDSVCRNYDLECCKLKPNKRSPVRGPR